METYNTIFKPKEIQSPMAAFNNFILSIGKEMQQIFNYDVYGTNNCIFEDESILLFGFIRLVRCENSMGIKVIDTITSENEQRFKMVFAYKSELATIFYRYLFILNDVRHNYDDSVNSKYVETIVNEIIEDNGFEQKMYLVPFKNKIFRNYDGTERNFIDRDIDKLFSRYTYVISIVHNGPIQYKWKLIRLLSSELNESYCIENTRLLDKEIIRDGLIQKENITQFMIKLMYYGEF